MSHFSMLVFTRKDGKALEALLAPYKRADYSKDAKRDGSIQEYLVCQVFERPGCIRKSQY